MKKIRVFLMVTFLICTIGFSCKKESKPGTTTVEYRITPMNVYFTKITFTDQTGADVIITQPSQLSNGSKSISISRKPFDAKMETEINNTTNQAITFKLVILVDGNIMAANDYQAPPMGDVINSIEYTLR